MWSNVSRELGVPWRAAEAMHWHLGEQEMARRAGVTPFTMAAASGPFPSPSAGPSSASSLGGPIGNSVVGPLDSGGLSNVGLSSAGFGTGGSGPPVLGTEGPPIRRSDSERIDERRRRRRRGDGNGGRGGTVLPSLAEMEGGVGLYDDDDDDDDDGGRR